LDPTIWTASRRSKSCAAKTLFLPQRAAGTI
jgi:hypothetical protein